MSSPPAILFRLNTSRARRFMRFRATALPSFRDAATPNRLAAPPFETTNNAMYFPWSRRPES